MDSTVIEVRTGGAETVVDLTGEVDRFLGSVDARDGLLNVWVPHATAGLAVIETGAGTESDVLGALRGILAVDDLGLVGWRPRTPPRAKSLRSATHSVAKREHLRFGG
jgi:hypothetical protein